MYPLEGLPQNMYTMTFMWTILAVEQVLSAVGYQMIPHDIQPYKLYKHISTTSKLMKQFKREMIY